jgi:hypothetical protein
VVEVAAAVVVALLAADRTAKLKSI